MYICIALIFFSLFCANSETIDQVSIWDEEAREEEEAAGDNSTSRLNKKEAKKLRWVSTTQIIGSSHRAYNHGWKTLLAFLVNHTSLSNLLDF